MATPAEETLNHKLTHRDLEYTPDDGNRYEIIDGVLFVSPFPSYAHQHAIARLQYVLTEWTLRHGLGTVLGPGLKVVLDEPTGVGPDLTFVSTARMAAMQDDGFYGAPDLMVEVLSSKPQLDRFVKFHKYAAAGVPNYWIIDPARKSLEAFRLAHKRYELEAAPSGHESFAPSVFPGLSIALRDLWT